MRERSVDLRIEGAFAFLKNATSHVTFGFWRGDECLVTRLLRDAARLDREKADPTKRSR